MLDHPGACIGETVPGEWANTWTTGKLLYALAERAAHGGDHALRQQTRRMFEALRRLAVWEGDRAYYWGIAPWRDGQWLLRNLTPAFVALFERLHADQPAATVAQALADLRRLEGGFVAQATFNDWVSYPGTPRLGAPGLSANGIQMIGCCSPEGMRALWETWNSIVQTRPEGVYVNLAMSREHPAATVTACQPAAGRIEVRARRGGTYFLRPPSWSDRSGWALRRDGVSAPALWGGSRQAYVICRDVQPGEILSLTWPVPAFTQSFVARSIPGRETMVTTR